MTLDVAVLARRSSSDFPFRLVRLVARASIRMNMVATGASGGAILRALCVGHLAAAAGFSGAVVTVWLLTSSELWTLQPGALEEFTKAAGALAIMTFVLMIPVSIIHAPFVICAVLWLRGSLAMACFVGALVGAGENAAILFSSGDFSDQWSRIGNPGDPRTGVAIMLCGAVAGIAYAQVIWRRCIGPYRAAQSS